MNRKYITILAVVLSCALLAQAGSISGKVEASKGTSVVYVQSIDGNGKNFPAPTAKVVMDQKGLQFVPHVMVVQVGTTVEFLNEDKVQHNVFWPAISGNHKLGHNMGTWPEGQKRSYKFDDAGVVPLLCNVHPDMSGYIVVSPTPYFATTNASGEYTIKDVPAGQYTVTAWHEGSKPSSKNVTVSGDAKQDFTLAK
jgi:plastocyanin